MIGSYEPEQYRRVQKVEEYSPTSAEVIYWRSLSKNMKKKIATKAIKHIQYADSNGLRTVTYGQIEQFYINSHGNNFRTALGLWWLGFEGIKLYKKHRKNAELSFTDFVIRYIDVNNNNK